MRVLLLFRGAPGCGKSTFIEEHGLKPYTLSADDIRLLLRAPAQGVNGEDEIIFNFKSESLAWNTLFKLLEYRMQAGEFTVIDATNSKTEEMNRYKKMADTYRYRIFIIDFTSLHIEECKKRNANRLPEYKRVPDIAIEKMYARFKTQKIPSGIKKVNPENLDSIFMKKFDMSDYKKIVVLGDIHGCYDPIDEYFHDFIYEGKPLDQDTMYIFVGDYIDRGIQNGEVLEFLLKIYNNKNVLLLEGNHDRNIWIYANEGVGNNKEFEFKTRPQLDKFNFNLSDIRQLYRRFGQCAWFTYGDKEFFISHAGIATMPKELGKIATDQFISGVGKYNDYANVADTWMDTTNDNQYQIFGHRNSKVEPIQMRDRVFNLEGKVEYGEDFRILEITHDGFTPISIKNNTFKLPEEIEEKKSTEITSETSIEDLVYSLRHSRLVNEKKFDNISSFNFSSRAFRDAAWNDQTEKARGLYINTNIMKIVARGYDKFFNIDERPETKFEMLRYTLTFPATAYVKENGYLTLVSYNEENDDLFITTKSDPTGDFAQWAANSFYEIIGDKKDEIKEYIKENNVTLVLNM